MTADLTALWHAAAPPPPPPSRSAGSGGAGAKPRIALDRVLSTISNRFEAGSLPSQHSSSAFSFDAGTKGDRLPEDTYSPEPSRPTSRAGAASERSRTPSVPSQPPVQAHGVSQDSGFTHIHHQQDHTQVAQQTYHAERQRTMSYTGGDQYAAWRPQPAGASYSAACEPLALQQQWPLPASQSHYVPPQEQRMLPHVQPPSVMSSVPYQPHHHYHWSSGSQAAYSPTAPSHIPQQSHTHSFSSYQTAPHSPYGSTPVGVVFPGEQQSSGGPVPSGPVPPPRSRSPRPVSLPSAPMAPGMVAVSPQSPSPAPAAPTPSSPLTPSRTIRRSLPQPPGPPGGTRTSTVPPLGVVGIASSTTTDRPMEVASDQAPVQTHAAGGAPGSPISRSESVRMAAEQLMSRGPPRRGRGVVGRFSRLGSQAGPSSSESTDSALTSASSSESSLRRTATLATAVQSSQSDPIKIASAQRPQAAAFAPALDAMSLTEEAEEEEATIEDSLRQPRSPQVPARPSSRGPRDDVLRNHLPHDRVAAVASRDGGVVAATPSFSFTGPDGGEAPSASSSKSSAVVTTTPTTGSLAPATTIPRIFSPPPNVAPPLDPSVASSTNGPIISVSAAEEMDDSPRSAPASRTAAPHVAVTPPSISISMESDPSTEGPMISVTAAEDEPLTGPATSHQRFPTASSSASTTSVSLHSGQGQRATATTTNMVHTLAGSTTLPHSLNSAEPRQQQSASSVAGIVCSSPKCGKYIAGRVISATLAGQPHYYHPDCFACSHCDEPLEHVAFYDFEGKPYCHFDYYELWAKRCFHCRTPIVDERFIRVDDPELVGAGTGDDEEDKTRYYHDLHFFCANCGDPFLDPKSAGATAMSLGQMGGVMDAEAACKPFVVHKGYPYCSPCHDNVHLPKCKGCKGPIRPDQEMLSALKAKWHEACLRCKRCHGSFREDGPGGGRMFVNDAGDVFDEDCYKIWLRGTL